MVVGAATIAEAGHVVGVQLLPTGITTTLGPEAGELTDRARTIAPAGADGTAACRRHWTPAAWALGGAVHMAIVTMAAASMIATARRRRTPFIWCFRSRSRVGRRHRWPVNGGLCRCRGCL